MSDLAGQPIRCPTLGVCAWPASAKALQPRDDLVRSHRAAMIAVAAALTGR
jgi:hypothetical protein